jgi:uncharacterized membrane protein
MIDIIQNFFLEIVGKELCVFFCSMLPIIELRGAIPLGAALGIPWWLNYPLAVLGNVLPVPFILLFIKKVLKWMVSSKIAFFNKIGNWLTDKAAKNRRRIERFSFWGVCIFVAIPLPMTGAWTGSLAAAVIDMKFWKALLSCFVGVLIAGIIMSLASYGVVAAFQIFS